MSTSITPKLLIRTNRGHDLLLAQNSDGNYLFFGPGGMPVKIDGHVRTNGSAAKPGWQFSTNIGMIIVDPMTNPTTTTFRGEPVDRIWHTDFSGFEFTYARNRVTIRKK